MRELSTISSLVSKSGEMGKEKNYVEDIYVGIDGIYAGCCCC